MQAQAVCSEGLERWRLLSADARYAQLPPLPRFVQAVRDQSQSAEELLDLAFVLCEANLEICLEEYLVWQGLCVVDATGVFSLQGLGGSLCHTYGYDFESFLRAIAELARRSADPAQYHQCINNNLFSSPVDDSVLLERLRALQQSTDLRSRGCMVDTGKLLSSLVKLEASVEDGTNHSSREQPLGQILITPRLLPEAFDGYGRSLKLNMEGEVLVKGPFCLNVCLEKPFFWFASIRLRTDWLTSSSFELRYQLQLDQHISGPLRLLLATTAAEPVEPGRGERHFWLHNAQLPHDARGGVAIPMDETHWLCLKGHPREAYGQKCSAANVSLINQLPMQLILALEASANVPALTGQFTLPSLKAVASNHQID